MLFVFMFVLHVAAFEAFVSELMMLNFEDAADACLLELRMKLPFVELW